MSGANDRLERLLGGAALAPLRTRLRSRYGRGRDGGIVTLNKLGDAERGALAGLLGRRPSDAGSLRFDIAELDMRLANAGLAPSLRHALELLDGPIVDVVAARAEAARNWETVRALATDSRLATLLADARGLGLLKRLAPQLPAAARIVGQAQAVLAQLPAAAVARSHLAAQWLGDAHALDPGSPVAAIVLAVLRRERALEDDSEGEETVRELWAAAGVLVNELARPVLFLNLPGSAVGASGEPGYLSLRALMRSAAGTSRRAMSTCAKTRIWWPSPQMRSGRIVRRWCAPMACPRQPSVRCCCNWRVPAPVCTTTATSIGRELLSRIRSSRPSPPGPGVLARTITAPRWRAMRLRRAHLRERRWTRAGTVHWR